jgi:hypothetical protein
VRAERRSLKMEEPILKQMEYPGGGIVMGITPQGELFCSYFMTGRSAPSRSRRFREMQYGITIEATRPENVAKGNPGLLLFNALLWHPKGVVVVGNGNQTDRILELSVGERYCPMRECTQDFSYLPDEPHFTQRISGRIIRFAQGHGGFNMEAGIIRRGPDGEPRRTEPQMMPAVSEEGRGMGYVLPSYVGGSKTLESFDSMPTAIHGIGSRSAEGLCDELGSMLSPKFRVGIAAVVLGEDGGFMPYVKNFLT